MLLATKLIVVVLQLSWQLRQHYECCRQPPALVLFCCLWPGPGAATEARHKPLWRRGLGPGVAQRVAGRLGAFFLLQGGLDVRLQPPLL